MPRKQSPSSSPSVFADVLEFLGNRWVAVLLVALPVLQGLNLALVSSSDARKFFSNLFQAVAAAAMAATMIRAARKLHREGSESAAGWSFIAAAACSWTMGMVSFMFVEMVLRLHPYPGVSDVFYFLFYLFMLFGLWRLPRESATRAEQWDHALDVGAFGAVSLVVIWHFSLRLLFHSLATQPGAGVVVSLGYTVVDTLLLLLIFSKLVYKLHQGRDFLPKLLLLLGGFCLIAADLLRNRVVAYTDFASGSPIDLGWVMFNSLGGLAACRLLQHGVEAEANHRTEPWIEKARTLWTLAITYLWVPMVLAMVIWTLIRPQDIHSGLLLAGALAATFMAITRQLRTLRENTRLYHELQESAAQLEAKVQERTAELQQQTERLLESDAFRKRVFDASRVPIVVMDAVTSRYLDCNPAAAQIYGFSSPKEVLGKTPLDVSTPAQYDGSPSPEKSRFYIKKALAVGSVVFEWRHQRPNGEIWDSEVHLMSFQSGERQLLQFTLQDITERKRTEQALAESEVRFRSIVQQSSDVIALLNSEGLITYISPQSEHVMGYRPAELVGQNPMSFIHVDDLPRLQEALSQVVQRINPGLPMEFRFRHAKGHWVQLEALGTNLLDHPSIRGLLVTSRDVTERNRAREALREKTEELDRFFDVTLDLLCIAGTDGFFRRLNPQWEKVLGYSLSDLEGCRILDLVHPDDQAATLAAIGKLAGQKEVLDFVNRYRCKNGSYRWIEWRSYPAGELIYAAARDITERKGVEEALRASETFLDTIIEHSPHSMWVSDDRGTLIRMNQACRDLLHATNEELVGRYNIFEDNVVEAQGAIPLVKRVFERGERVRFTLRYDSSQLRSLHLGATTQLVLEVTISPVLDARRRVTHAIIQHLDTTERTQAEETIRANDARLRAIIDGAPFGAHSYEVQADGRLVFTGGNKAADMAVGIDHSLLIGKTIEQAFPKLEGTPIPAAYRRVATTGEGFETDQVEYEQQQIRGAFEIHAFNTGSNRMTVFFRDITERKRAEERIRQLANEQRTILDTIIMGISFLKNRKHQWVNSAFARIFGYEPQEITGMDSSLFYSDMEEYRRVGEEGYAQLAAGGVYRTESLMKRKDGTLFWCSLTGQAINSQNLDEGSIWVLHDITERKQAEERVRQLANEQKTVLNTIQIGIVLLKHRKHQWINHAFATMFGYEAHEMAGVDTRQMYVSEADYRRVGQEGYAQLAAAGIYKTEALMKRKDGTQLWCDLTGQAINPQNLEEGSVWALQDVTERRRAEEALRRSEANLQLALEAARMGDWSWDIVTGEVVWSARCKALYGLPPEAVVTYERFLECLHPEDRERIATTLRRAVEERSDYDVEKRAVWPDGSMHWNATRGRVLCNAAGEAVRVVGVTLDVTERKRAEAALRESEERFRHMFEHCRAIMLLVDPETGAIAEANPAAAEFYGHARERLCQMVIEDINVLPPDQVKSARQNTDREQGADFIFPHRLASGEIRTVEVRSSPVSVSGRRLLFSIVQDITERKRAEASLRESMRRLQAVVNGAPIVLYSFDRQGVFTLSEGKGISGLGLKPGEIVGRSVFDVYGGQPEQVAALRRALDGESFSLELSFPAGGTFEVSHVAMRDEAGDYDGTIGVLVDITERKRAEEALRQINQTLSAIITASPVAILALDTEGKVTQWSPAAERIFGWSEREVLGKFNPIVPEDKRGEFQADFSRVRSGKEYSSEVRRQGKDGLLRDIGISTAPLRDAAGNVTGAVGMMEDITERKRAEQIVQSLSQLGRQLGAVSGMTQAAEAVAGGALDLLGWDACFVRLRSPDHAHVRDVLTVDTIEGKQQNAPSGAGNEITAIERRVMEAGPQLILREDPDREEKLVMFGDKSRPSASLLYVPLRHQGRYLGFFSIQSYQRHAYTQASLDLLQTLADYAVGAFERIRAQEALHESEAALASLFAAIPAGEALMVNRRFVKVNQALCRITGYSEEELLQATTRILYPDEEEFQRVGKALYREGVPSMIEARMQRKDGTPIDVLLGLSPFDPADWSRGAAASVLDISDRKHAEAVIRRLNEELEQRVVERTAQLEAANKELEAFSYSVSHDLRSPLRHIAGYVSLLNSHAGAALDPEGHRLLETVTDAAGRMGRLIDDLLAFSRLSRAPMRLAAINLHELVQECRQELAPDLKGRSIEWVIPSLPEVPGDRALLKQVWLNLLGNAVKYTRKRAEARIELGCQDSEKEWQFSVRDNGMGFNMKYANKLFGVFQRLHSEAEIEGTGIGLANVRRMILRHGGRTWAEGEVNQGAIFFFTLPKQAPILDKLGGAGGARHNAGDQMR